MIVGIIIGLIVLLLLVVVHELGHAVVARRNGVVVKEFAVGFPPAAKKWRPKRSFLGNNVVFSVNWLPLGGFVRLKGEYDAATGDGTYGGASYWVKTKILFAGVMMNWLVAIILFSVVAVLGLPKLLPQQLVLPFDARIERSPLTVAQVAEQSPAAAAGITKGDHIVSVGGHMVDTPAALTAVTHEHIGRMTEVVFVHQGVERRATVQLNNEEQAKRGGVLGVGSAQSETVHSTWSAPLVGVAMTGQLTYETLKGVGGLLAKTVNGAFGQWFGSAEQRQAAKADLATVGENVAGPIGILGVLFPSVVDAGVTHILLLAAIISLTLAVMNVLPIPALDGGRWTTMTLFRVLKKDLTREREETIQATGFLLLMALTVVITWSDIAKIL